ncbi:MAG: hypothetical protein AAB897_03715 [Patescibacteria group bacterium]
MARFSPEQPFENRPDRLSEAEEALYKILVPENKLKAIKIEDFGDLYGEGTIAADREKVAVYEARFRKEEEDPIEATRKQRRELFEAITNFGIEEGGWLGADTTVVRPSRYDDIIGGVDSVVEFPQRKGVVALKIDITKSDDLEKKFASIKESIENGWLSRVKYFNSPDFRGELKFVPGVVIGADHRTMTEIVDLILKFKRTRTDIQRLAAAGEKAKVKERGHDLEQIGKQIAHHPMQMKIIFEIRAQLENFRDYAGKVIVDEAKRKKVVSAYTRVLEIIDSIEREKSETEEWSDLEKDFKEAGEDMVCHAIIMEANKIGGRKSSELVE